MQPHPMDLIERLRAAGDNGAADSVTEIARSLALVKRYFEECTGAQADGADSAEAKCLAAVNDALECVHRPY
jgi:hypothetical protein